jgi:hypothetical protein
MQRALANAGKIDNPFGPVVDRRAARFSTAFSPCFGRFAAARSDR